MRASKFTDAQMAFTIKQDEAGITVAEIYRKAGISQATYLNWKKCYGGLMSSGDCHVWGCGHVSGLLTRSVTAGPDEVRWPGPSQRSGL